ncbi:MAG: 3'-5' exonuclease [Ruminococcus sp.]|nr:3'-5' exonuclease [Ruminococcus sp.]
MGWTILAIFVLCLVCAIASNVQTDKIEKKKQAEQRVKDMAKREEEYKKEVEEKKRRLQELEERRKKGPQLFEEELNGIEKASVTLSDEKINNNLVSAMGDIKIYTFRSDTTLASCGNYTVIDVETTGLKIQSEIIELSAIRVRDFKPIKAYTTLIKPKKEIPFDITDLTGITNEMVSDAPSIKQVLPDFIDFVGKDNLLGHNLPFDLKFLYKYGFDFQKNRRRYYDTLEMAKKTVRKMPPPGAYDNGSWEVMDYKLDSLCSHFEIYRNTAHRSLSDCLATSKLFQRLLKRFDL